MSLNTLVGWEDSGCVVWVGRRPLTLGVVQRVHVSADVALQVGVEAGRRGEEGQADGHQLPASLQAVVAEVLRGLATQLDVQLVPETLVAPPAHHHLMGKHQGTVAAENIGLEASGGLRIC